MLGMFVAAALAAQAGFAPMVATATPPPAVALAPGEVLLQIVAQGERRLPADRFAMTVNLNVAGANATGRRDAKLATVRKALVSIGIAPSDIVASPFGRTGFVGNESIDQDDAQHCLRQRRRRRWCSNLPSARR